MADLGWGQRTCPHYLPAPPMRISRQNEVLSGPLHPHNVIITSCLIYFKLCGATLHFGVPEWLQELACMRCTKEDAGAEQQPLCILHHSVSFMHQLKAELVASALSLTVWMFSVYSQSEKENWYIMCYTILLAPNERYCYSQASDCRIQVL